MTPAVPFRHGSGRRHAPFANPDLNKYSSRNPFVRAVVDRFVEAVSDDVARFAPSSWLDVGAGEGVVPARVARRLAGARVVAADLDRAAYAPPLEALQASATALPFAEGAFDMASAMEVLEHLSRPDLAVAELARVARSRVLVTVPHEPFFRAANLARFTYVRALGNTPGHVQHWTLRSFRAFLRPLLDDVEVRPVSLWLVAHGRPKRQRLAT